MSGERRAIRKAIADAFELDFKTENPTLDKAADSVMEVFDKFRPLPGTWGLATGGRILQTSADELTVEIKRIGEMLERELRFNNLADHRDFNTIAKKIIAAEKQGQKLETWIAWAKRDEKSRAYLFTYARNPNLIWMDWLQAFPVGNLTKVESDGGMYV